MYLFSRTYSFKIAAALLLAMTCSRLSAVNLESPTLEDQAEAFQKKISQIEKTNECVPLHVAQDQGINVLYLYCSDEAIKRNSSALKITDNFTVSERLARRFNFWRSIYSLWNADQYVLHVSVYPEVIFASGDGGSLWEGLTPFQKERHTNKVMNRLRVDYRSLLLKMHATKAKPENFSPAMQRVAQIMQHIADINKYRIAAENLRVQRGQRTSIATGLGTAGRYMSAVEAAFNQEGLPPELARIAFIESSFNLKAHSKVGASGIYQIMPATGREFLLVGDDIDERHDPIKAAHAAARLLRRNFESAGKWPLAITAYNHGLFGIQRAVKTVGSAEIEDLIEKYEGPAFGFASKNFYCGFLALIASVGNAKAIFPEVKLEAPISFYEIKMNKASSLAKIRKQYGLSAETILDFNPDLDRQFVRNNGLLPRGYVLKVPSDASRESLAQTVSTEIRQ